MVDEDPFANNYGDVPEIYHSLKFPNTKMELNSTETEGEESLKEQELEIVEAIVAAHEPPITRKRPFSQVSSHTHRRQLPTSLLALPSSLSVSLLPCQANMRVKYPSLRFGGQILYSRSSVEVEKATKELHLFLEANKSEAGQVSVGFDIEWKPTFIRGVLQGKAAVMQICGDTNRCYVMHIIHSGIPPSLQLLLEDFTILKVGDGIRNDAGKVYRDYNVSVKASKDLSYLANLKIDGDSKKWGLASLTETLFCKEVIHHIPDQTLFLNERHKKQLKEEFNAEPWTFEQHLGDAVFIPAGCPHQVRNRQSCIKVALDFVSPENVGECIRLIEEFLKSLA